MHLLFFILYIIPLPLSSSQPHHFLKPPSPPSSLTFPLPPQQSIELTPPLSTGNLPPPPPECTHHLFNHSFGNTYSQPPFTTTYFPPSNCSPPWSHAVLHFSGEISGNQYDRIAGIWLSGVEILRTSTPEPSDYGTFWNVKKDITRYNSLLQLSNISLSMMLENIVNDEFTGIYHINVSILFYKDGNLKNFGGRKLGFGDEIRVYEEPADLVIPVVSDGNLGYWFRIEDESQVGLKRVEFPANARRIVLELYVSYHGDDEFWYSNPPNEYIEMNNLTISRGNGAIREVLVKIDGNLVGHEVPFPVIFTGGINPLSWDPVVAIGAFDLPSYNYEMTPFLGGLLDGKNHSVEIVVANAISFWLVDANLHVWLDKNSKKVEAGVGVSKPSEYQGSREFKFKQLDGEFEVEVERKIEFSGWVAYSSGNFTTTVYRKLKFKNTIKFEQNGAQKVVEQKVKVKTQVEVVSECNELVSSRTLKSVYPLRILTSTVNGLNDTYLTSTDIKHGLKEKSSNGDSKTSLKNIQESKGQMLVKGHDVLSGFARTTQTLSYNGPSGCLLRTVDATGGMILVDSTSVCSAHSNQELSSW